MTGIGSKIGILALIVFGLFMVGVGSAWLGPDWRVDSVHGTTVICHERWHSDHTRPVIVTPSAAAAIAVDDKCPA